ncbi:hypothetical protein PR202_gb06231 [Eleusine coracana subsp. coracana]|uniref:Exocyst subunit Exo70 family protein n=1 Tax=Eleusine coracana subsp. coracana TaxID=191504 RepID=A0AAV5E6K2_ELECO|nr:hypothetical protein PR202_gb06231 [Eleusine coracana subsp. coracana]
MSGRWRASLRRGARCAPAWRSPAPWARRWPARGPASRRSSRRCRRWRPPCARSARRGVSSPRRGPTSTDRAVGPAAAVLKVFDAVHGLEPPLLADGAAAGDLPGYLAAVLARLEEAHRFLSDNCGLAAQWLADIVEYLGDRDLADPRFLADLGATLEDLKTPSGDLDGGLLAAALDILEAEFRRLLSDHSAPLAMQQPGAATPSAVPTRVPAAAVQKLCLILDRLVANGRQERCVSTYVDARGAVVSASLHALGLEYLHDPSADAQALGPAVELWGRHLEFVVRCLLESERQLCVKEVFDSLNKLRLDFNRLFGGKACAEIQSQTRDLVKLVVDGSVEIFEELIVQVELQRRMPPPVDGGVPRLVSFIVEYCNQLLDEKYRPVLGQNLKATKLGEILGDVWLREHEQYKDYYLTMFIRESWGALSPLLNREGLILFSKGRATARDLVKQRLKTFNSSFDEMICTQSSWVIPDKDLREKTCDLVVQTIVPSYRSYMQNYGPLVEQEGNAGRYVKYTVDGLEKMLRALFMPRPRRAGSFQMKHSSGKITSAMTGLHRSASAVK